VSNSEARLLLKRESDTISIYTVNQATDQSMLVSLDGENGEVTVMNGNAFLSMKDGSISIGINGGGALVIDKDGVKVAGKSFTANTSAVALGFGASVPVANSALSPVPSVFVPPA